MIQRILTILNLLLVALAVYGSIDLLYAYIENRLHFFQPAVSSKWRAPAAETETSGIRPAEYAVIVQRDLFNTIGTIAPEQQPEADIARLKQTDLKLKLWGTASTADRKSGLARAVIENTALRQQCLYRVGDTVEHAKISEILRNSVVLDINGRREKLILEEDIPRPEISLAVEEWIPPDTTPSAAAVPVGTGQKVALPRSQVDNALENISQLMDDVKIRPYYQKGEAAGFIVANIAPESAVQGMGLKDGDIVTRINGQQIKSADDAMAFYETLKAGEKLTVEFLRRGRPQVIEFEVEDEMLGGK